jgi:RNA polymerase sigma factor (sigma-70 family)
MLNRQQEVILPQLCRLIGSQPGRDSSDGDLLQRFLGQCDGEAFAALVRRHGATVLGVCRRVLRNAHDAEDAFQATFLVLAQKARSITRGQSLGSWLYGVAYRVALRARADAARRRRHERQAAVIAENRTECTARQAGSLPHDGAGAWDEVRPVLDEEVNRLPDKYRRPVVLCYFEGKTYQEAARLLGWPAGTASVRLARARELLRQRLALRGLALSSCALATGLAAEVASAADVALLAEPTAGAAVRWLTGPAAGLSTQVIALTEGVVKAMFVRKLTTLASVTLVLGMTLGGAGALWRLAQPAPAAAVDEPAAAARAAPPADSEPPFLRAEAPRAVAPPAGEGARPLQSRIGLINMARVLKGSKKAQALQRGLRTSTEEARQKLEALSKEVQARQAECNDSTTPEPRREEHTRRIRELKREIEDEQERAQARVNKQTGDVLKAVYREVEAAADRIAKLKGLELVLFYSDAVTEADFYNPANLQRKMSQPGALMPLVVAPGMDVTETVIEVLDRTWNDRRP